MNQLVRCINCDEIFLKTPFDLWPEYDSISNRSPESFRSIEKDDFQEFLRNHRGHRLEDMQIIKDSFVSEKAYSEPIKISYFKATNGKESFVIKKFREKIDQPLTYQLIAGDYFLKCVGIEIQNKEITKQLEAEFRAAPLPQNKMVAFLTLYRQVVKILDIKNLERVLDESPNPLEVYYKLNDVGLAYLLRNCRNIFKGQRYLDIEEFIHRHKDDGVLLLKATYQIQVSEKVPSEKKAIPAQIPLEKKKMIEIE
jgi:hypothetical protein